MRLISKTRIVRGMLALSVAASGYALRANDALAVPMVIAILNKSNPSCSGDGTGSYVAETWGLNSTGSIVCDVATQGSTAYSSCTSGATQSVVNVSVIHPGGSSSPLRSSGRVPWGSTATAIATVGSTASCSGGATLTARGGGTGS
jgi:hypothetical protein